MFDLHEIVNSLLRTMKGIVPCSIDNINATASQHFNNNKTLEGYFTESCLIVQVQIKLFWLTTCTTVEPMYSGACARQPQAPSNIIFIIALNVTCYEKMNRTAWGRWWYYFYHGTIKLAFMQLSVMDTNIEQITCIVHYSLPT